MLTRATLIMKFSSTLSTGLSKLNSVVNQAYNVTSKLAADSVFEHLMQIQDSAFNKAVTTEQQEQIVREVLSSPQFRSMQIQDRAQDEFSDAPKNRWVAEWSKRALDLGVIESILNDTRPTGP